MSTRSVEAAAVADFGLPRRKRDKPQDKLYDIEVVEEAGARVSIHCTGYGSEYDEWRPRSEVILNKPGFLPSSEEESYCPLIKLACSIKSLKPSRSEEAEVRIQVPCDLGTFRLLQHKGILAGRRRGGFTDDTLSKEQYTITCYSDLDELLGEKWHFRVTNPIGDFSCHT